MRVEAIEHKRVILLGLGREGQATYRFIRRHYPAIPLTLADAAEKRSMSAEFLQTIADDRAATLLAGPHYLDSLKTFDIAFKSPGIPLRLPPILEAVQNGLMLSSLTALFFGHAPSPIIGVTGTKGKSTTSSLIHHILRHAGQKVELVGNIGIPSLESLREEVAPEYFVYELSSFQLEGLETSPKIAVLLNIFDEHTDHHETVEHYISAKERITRYQNERDLFIFNGDDRRVQAIAERSPAQKVPFSRATHSTHSLVSVSDQALLFHEEGQAEVVLRRDEIPLIGEFNLNNVVASATVALIVGVPPSAVAEAIRSFTPLKHRLECIGTFHGISFYNGTLSTVPEVTIAHLEALGDQVQSVIMGGFDRNTNFRKLGEILSNRKIEHLILFPSTGRRIWEAVLAAEPQHTPTPVFVSDMAEAVRTAYRVTDSGRTCLLSPASPSYGMFKNHVDRGEQFVNQVTELGSAPTLFGRDR